MVGSPKSDVRCYYFIRKTPNSGLANVNFLNSDLLAHKPLSFRLLSSDYFFSTEKRHSLFPGIFYKLRVCSAGFVLHYSAHR